MIIDSPLTWRSATAGSSGAGSPSGSVPPPAAVAFSAVTVSRHFLRHRPSSEAQTTASWGSYPHRSPSAQPRIHRAPVS
ncbi:hypothetical protein DV517_09980 [Streptomyces sp. S816]|nr:hypothetical protein DV517_09980 [Streptomyces sp. S816]